MGTTLSLKGDENQIKTIITVRNACPAVFVQGGCQGVYFMLFLQVAAFSKICLSSSFHRAQVFLGLLQTTCVNVCL